jgi:hypothetical protein
MAEMTCGGYRCASRMLSLIVGSGSFQKSRMASGGSNPNAARATRPAHPGLMAIAMTSAISTHPAEAVILMC